MIEFTPKQIAAAVQGYIRALRLLGHDDAHIAQIADALNISEQEVEETFRDFQIVGAKIDPQVRVNHIRPHGTFSQLVRLKQRRHR